MIAPIREQVPLPQLPARDRGDVTVVSLRGELYFVDMSALQAYLSDIRWRGGRGALLTSPAMRSSTVPISVSWFGIPGRSGHGAAALPWPQGVVGRVLFVTGLITWFEVQTRSRRLQAQTCRLVRN